MTERASDLAKAFSAIALGKEVSPQARFERCSLSLAQKSIEALQLERVNLGILSLVWLRQCETAFEVFLRLGVEIDGVHHGVPGKGRVEPPLLCIGEVVAEADIANDRCMENVRDIAAQPFSEFVISHITERFGATANLRNRSAVGVEAVTDEPAP